MVQKLTPLQIKNKEFPKSVGGYKRDEVKLFLNNVAELVDEFTRENRTLKNQIEASNKRISELERQTQTIKEVMELQRRQILQDAQAEANKILSDAQAEADRVLSDAQRQVREMFQSMNTEIGQRKMELYELTNIFDAYKRGILKILGNFTKTINDFEKEREIRRAKQIVAPFGMKIGIIKPLDPIYVLRNTFNRRKRVLLMQMLAQEP